MTITLDTRRIRRCTFTQLSAYYRELDGAERNEITRQLLAAIATGSIAPQTYQIWLGVTKCPHVIRSGLKQTFSIVVRQSSITHLDKAFRSKRWKETWEALGSTQGFLDILSDLSVCHVKEICTALGQVGKRGDLSERRECVTQLFKALQPRQYPDAPFKTSDKRPLTRHYLRLVPSCTEKLAAQFLCDKTSIPALEKHMLQYHPEVVRTEQMRALNSEEAFVNQQRLKNLLTRYPQPTGHQNAGFSASMDFAVDTLRVLVEGDAKRVDDVFFINDLAWSLLHRSMRKKVGWQKREEIVRLITQYLQKHPHAASEAIYCNSDILQMVTLCWIRKPDLFERHLTTLLSLSSSGAKRHDLLTECVYFVRRMLHLKRYAALKFVFRGLSGIDIDIENDLKRLKGSLSDTLLEELTPQEALGLFTRLRHARGDDHLVISNRPNTILQWKSSYMGAYIDYDLFHVYLLARNNDLAAAKGLAASKIEDRQNKAKIASAPEQRGFWAKSALYYAVASGDIALFRDVLTWTKRFINDPLVVRDLHRDMPPNDFAELLSGIPRKIMDYGALKLRARVCASNAVLREFFDIAKAAAHSRSFTIKHWEGTLKLYQLVVQERIKLTKKIKNALGFDDEQIYNVLWEDTIAMLLDVERQAHSSEAALLHLDLVRGPLSFGRESYYDMNIRLQTKDASTHRFFDNLAKARDEFYQKLRPTLFPDVLTLPKPFPRGLPIQHLTAPWSFNAQSLEQSAPYMASRIKAVLFPDPADSFQQTPTDKESKAAIGTFVDSFKYAFSLYVPSTCDEGEQVRRYNEVWDHAVGPLSLGRMNEEEAGRFWRAQRHWQGMPMQVGKPPHRLDSLVVDIDTWPGIPDVDDPSQPHEWEVQRPQKVGNKKRALGALTYLDLSLDVSGSTPTPTKIRSELSKVSAPVVPAKKKEAHLRMGGEGGLLFGLLHLEAKHGASHGRLLEKPFPSAEDARFPSLYIEPDPDFTSVQGDMSSFPPALLHLSAKNIMSAYPDLGEWETFASIRRVSTSDRPALAKDLVLRAIIDYPNAGSWHRYILAPWYLNRLRPSDAKELYVSFADAILEKIQQSREGMKQPTEAGKPVGEETPFVKITTIKLLAQLLNKTEFIDDAEAFAILSALIKKSTHVDVRLNTTKTLLSMLNERPASTGESILKALESVIPIAGNLNERKPITEDEWAQAEMSLVLREYPAVVDETPILTLLLTHFGKGSDNEERERVFIDRVLLPTIDELSSQTSRWAKIFLAKHGVEADVPAVPSRMRTLTLLWMKKWPLLPRRLLENLVVYVTFNIAPPVPIAALNKKLRANAKAKEPGVQTWLDLYGQGVEITCPFRSLDISAFLDQTTKLDSDVGITPAFIHDQFMHLFNALLLADTPLHTNLSTNILANMLNGTYLSKPWWPTHGVALVQAMLARVDAIRATGSKRAPSVLPDTYPWRLLLLPHPLASEGTDVEGFADGIAGLIDGMPALYHRELGHLKHYLSLQPLLPSDSTHTDDSWTLAIRDNKLRVAVLLGTGSVGGTDVKADVLRKEVAGHVVVMALDGLWDADVKKEVGRMVDIWKESADEAVRRLGWEVGGRIEEWSAEIR